jgi:hypothetical protein
MDHNNFISTVIRNNGLAFEYLAIYYKDLITQFALAAVQQNAKAIEYVPSYLIDAAIAKQACSNYDNAILYIPTNLSNYLELALEAVSKDASVLQFIIPTNSSNYQQIALQAVSKDASVLKFIPTNLSNYQEIAQAALNPS